MRTEMTARHTTWNKKLKQTATEGLERLERLLGDGCSAHIVLTVEKSRQSAEVNVTCRDRSFVAREEGFDMQAALQGALDKVETQAQKHNARTRSRKRSPGAGKGDMVQVPPRGAKRVRPLIEDPDGAPPPRAESASAKTRVVPVVTHSFPATTPLPEPHIVRSPELVSRKPLTLEEAVKEAAFRDREVFVFRNPEGRVHVLYRQRDGRMGLIEAP